MPQNRARTHMSIFQTPDPTPEGREARGQESHIQSVLEVEDTLRGHRTNTGSEMQPTSMWEQDTSRVGMQSTEIWGFGVTIAS